MRVKEYLKEAKDRIIHEFEYKNGKYIQHYLLGGEHEMTPQEIVDCLNALVTMDCDLQTAYAYIKEQDELITKKVCEEIRSKLNAIDWYNLPKGTIGSINFIIKSVEYEKGEEV